MNAGPRLQPPLPPTIPRILTQEQYESEWKPKGWRLIIIGPTATWREEWGVWEAIRDIVQNCLDETEAYQYGYDEQGLWIADKGRGVAVEDFLLGPPKLKPEYARGKFGEGMKIAALALLRKSYAVHVHTVRKELWIVFLEQKVNGRVQTLAALWKPNGTARGTRFHIIGYHGSAFHERFAVNIPRSQILSQSPSRIESPALHYNQLIRPGKPPDGAGGWVTPHTPFIYCRDIYLRDINSPWSYNLWDFEVAPDRHGPRSEAEMFRNMGRLWSSVTKISLVKQLIPMLTDPEIHGAAPMLHSIENDRMQMPSQYYTSEDTSRLWQQAWNSVVGRDAVLRTDPKYDGMVQHLGYRSVSVVIGVRSAFENLIKTDKELVRDMSEKLEQARRIPDAQITPRQQANLELARALASRFSPEINVWAAIIPPASDMVSRTAGLYEYITGEIKISADMLDHARDTVSVMVHELGHHIAYHRNLGRFDPDPIINSADLTPGHAHAMEKAAGDIAAALMSGQFDEELSNVEW